MNLDSIDRLSRDEAKFVTDDLSGLEMNRVAATMRHYSAVLDHNDELIDKLVELYVATEELEEVILNENVELTENAKLKKKTDYRKLKEIRDAARSHIESIQEKLCLLIGEERERSCQS
ncbi:MAG: hypothetical protein HC888_00660 [Candidatus Competibacteraceae bacterium]|nr:hypothetical protein [Candidatus Competibacteraceae bacterium]